MKSQDQLEKVNVFDVMERLEVQLVTGECSVCGCSCFGSICVSCEGYHDGINKFYSIYPLFKQQEELQKAAGCVKENSIERRNIHESMRKITQIIDEQATWYQEVLLLPINGYTQTEQNLYTKNNQTMYQALTEFPELREKLFENTKFKFNCGHCYETLKYQRRILNEYISIN